MAIIINNNVGMRLKKLRLDFGFTQKQVADYLGFKQSQIAKLENNERVLKHSSLLKLCDLYNCSCEYILEGQGTYDKPNFAFKADKKDLKLETLARMNIIIRNLNKLSDLSGGGDEL